MVSSSSFNNPLDPGKFPTITDLIVAIMNVAIIIATPIVIFYLIFAGFKYVVARGNPEKVQEASRALLYGVIGGVVILASVAILTIIKNLVAAF